MFSSYYNATSRLTPYGNRLQYGPRAPFSPWSSGFSTSGARISPATGEAEQDVAQKSASAGQSVSVNRATQVNNHVQKVTIVIDPDVIKQLANGSLLEEMRIKNQLANLFAGNHGSFSNDQQHDVAVGADGSQTVNSRAKVDNNPQLVKIAFRNVDNSSELQAANNIVSLSADTLNEAGLAPISALQVMDQGAYADRQSRSVNNLRQRAEKNQDIHAKADNDVLGYTKEEFFKNLIGVVNHILWGHKDGPQEPPIKQQINQAAGAAETSIAINNGQQVHQARQNVTLYIGDFDKSGSDTTHDYSDSPASRFNRNRSSYRTPVSRRTSFLADVFA
ncbi:MAG: hypothetical protein QF473_04735 [Planctomycetota bacterium]|jgi:hypothetical protein|nr:hypothetical protein [Planctomycetota bacterium]MDP6354379.1 hypothetical protein [Planctomycetota bacterium]MDP7131618.1 hypothetical protein [Planctomycetota bacterium]MDP7253679.1 hypothetical protein [Planctomycetota bacterium]